MKDKLNYGTWIRKKKMLTITAIALLFIGLALFGFFNKLFLIAIIPALFFLYMAFIVILNYYQFSPSGGDYQNKIHNLLIERVTPKDTILDIGCGNGHLAIKIAKKCPDSKIIGLDYWGKEWEYAASICENNARLENLPSIKFIQGSASELPFENNSIDCIVSCLTFHEVQQVPEKEDCLMEALRVLKENGHFAFIDLFDDPSHYPLPGKYKKIIVECGGCINEDLPVNELVQLPFPLNDKRSLKHARLIAGYKISSMN
jgi:SAM-dependent methyltransferase